MNSIDTDELTTGGEAIKQMLSEVQVDQQLKALKKDVVTTKSPSKRDAIVKKIKYLAGVKKTGLVPEQAFILHNIPVVPPLVRTPIQTGSNRIEYADVNNLYKDHMLINNALEGTKDDFTADDLKEGRRDLYLGARAIFGVGDAISGNSRGKQLKGFVRQISGDTGPKQGFFHSKLLSKKQDFSGRGTIYADANLGFNEAAIPKDMLWTMYEFHIIRDLVKNGYNYVDAKKAVESRNTAATNSFNKMIKHVPTILNRAPTLMASNITAFYPVPIEGKTLGINPLHLKLFAADYDGDAVSVFVPTTPDAVEEAKNKLLPQHHIWDYRKGNGKSLAEIGHEAVIGSIHITEPDITQAPVTFKTEKEALAALKAGTIKENTPISIG
jgi:DNA-directed RNA polymerase subunit beta'